MGRNWGFNQDSVHTITVPASSEPIGSFFRASELGPDGQRGLMRLVQRDRLQPEGVFAGRNHRQMYWASVPLAVKMFRLQPRAETGVVDFRIVSPEIGTKAALNLQVIQLQLDHRNMPWKIAPDIGETDMQPG